MFIFLSFVFVYKKELKKNLQALIKMSGIAISIWIVVILLLLGGGIALIIYGLHKHEDKGEKTSTHKIMAVAGGVLILVAVILFIVFIFKYRKSNKLATVIEPKVSDMTVDQGMSQSMMRPDQRMMYQDREPYPQDRGGYYQDREPYPQDRGYYQNISPRRSWGEQSMEGIDWNAPREF
jgi:hypothetical protein